LTEPTELTAFWRGDDRAIEAVYREHVASLLGAARWIVGPAEAESVVQEVFVELIRNEALRRRFTGGSMNGWLTAIARLKGFEHRKRARRPALAAEAPPDGEPKSPEPRLEARDLLQRFLDAGLVSEVEAAFFRGRFLDCRTQVELAIELRVPRSTLEGWEHRLCERFRRFAWEGA
jgi:DNA-directed RNA polymerase specialized sigma24 family protein